MQQGDKGTSDQPKQNVGKARLTTGRLQALTTLPGGQQATLIPAAGGVGVPTLSLSLPRTLSGQASPAQALPVSAAPLTSTHLVSPQTINLIQRQLSTGIVGLSTVSAQGLHLLQASGTPLTFVTATSPEAATALEQRKARLLQQQPGTVHHLAAPSPANPMSSPSHSLSIATTTMSGAQQMPSGLKRSHLNSDGSVLLGTTLPASSGTTISISARDLKLLNQAQQQPALSPSRSLASSAIGGPSPKKIKLEAKPAPNKETENCRQLVCSHKRNRMREIKKRYRNHLTELFYIQGGGNMTEFNSWKKRPSQPLLNFLEGSKLDSEDEDEPQEKKINDEVKVLTSAGSNIPLATPVAISTTLPPSVSALSQQGSKQSVAISRKPFTVLSCSMPASSSTAMNPLTTTTTSVISTPLPATTSSELHHHLAKTADVKPNINSIKNISQSGGTKSNKSNTSPSRARQQSISSVYENVTGGSQDVIVERAKQEAQVLQRVNELRKEGLWSAKRLPRVQEPPRQKAHWDYLLEEMTWLAADFIQERKWKKAAARKLARMVNNHFKEQEQKELKAEKEESIKLKKIASQMAKMVKEFWVNIEKVVQYKQTTRMEEKKKKALDLHLSFIVDQTEKYSSWLTAGLQNTDGSRTSSLASDAEGSMDSGEEFLPMGTASDDEETIEQEENESGVDETSAKQELEALQKESELPLEELLKSLPQEMLENPTKDVHFDDLEKEDPILGSSDTSKGNDEDFTGDGDDESDVEETIEEQETHEKKDYSEELHDLKAEGEMSVEELMKKYSGAYDSDFEMPQESSEDDASEEEDSSVYNYSMSSKSTKLRQLWKEKDPEKYAQYLEKQRVRAKARRDAKREQWENEPHTRAMIAEKEKENQQARDRMRKHSERKRSEGRRVLRRTSDHESYEPPVKRPKDMTEEERREHNAELKRRSRARQTPQKKRWAKVKNTEYQRRHRERKRGAHTSSLPADSSTESEFDDHPALQTSPDRQPNCLVIPEGPLLDNVPSPSLEAVEVPGPSRQPPGTPQRAKKTIWNLTSLVKSTIKGKIKSSKEYAQVIKGLVTPKTPEKRSALQKIGVTCTKEAEKEPAMQPSSLVALKRRRGLSLPQSRTFRDAQAFYLRQDVARILPHKRYATKAGPGRLMLMTLKEAFILFKKENPEAKIGFTKFTLLRPKTVRLIGRGTPETCACMYCLNVRLKNEVLNKTMSSNLEDFRMPPETKMLDLLLCEKMDNGWHHPLCLEGKCVTCGSPAEYIGSKFQGYMDSQVNWQHWERVSQDGRTRLELVFKSGKLRDLFKEFIEKDIMQPSQGSTFVRHLHTFFWQYSQYSLLKGSLQEDEAIMVMDFAENRKASYAVEVKSAHFGKAQITMHPTVCFYKVGEVQMRHSMVFLSDDICHDYHAVHHFTLASIEALAKAAPLVQRVYIFSDGCAGQYKGKGTFADLSLYTGKRIQRVFFGSEHGKGEADGETGVINRAVDRAVSSGRLTVRNAEDLHTWCSKELTRREQPSLRDFFLVPREEIIRDRPQTDVVTIPGTRRIHQAERVSDYIIRTRMLACFCEACRRDSDSCPNQAYVGTYTVHKLKSSHSTLDDAFLEDDGVESTSAPEPPQISSANDPKVGDFVSVKYTLGKKQLIYNAVVIEPCQPLEDSELMVSFLKGQGTYFVFPEKEEVCLVGKEEVVAILQPPRIDNRRRHFF